MSVILVKVLGGMLDKIGYTHDLFGIAGLLSDILVGSRSSTPTARKSPVSDAGVQVTPPPPRDDKKSPKQQRPPQDR